MKWDDWRIKGIDFLLRYGMSAVIFKDALYLIGGSYSNQNNKNQVLIFRFGKGTPIFVSFSFRGKQIYQKRLSR